MSSVTLLVGDLQVRSMGLNILTRIDVCCQSLELICGVPRCGHVEESILSCSVPDSSIGPLATTRCYLIQAYQRRTEVRRKRQCCRYTQLVPSCPRLPCLHPLALSLVNLLETADSARHRAHTPNRIEENEGGQRWSL